MTGYDASVLNDPELCLLLIVPNWLGDGIMAMPAVQLLREQLHPDARILVAARPGQCGLWEMHSPVSQVLPLPARCRDLLSSAQKLRSLSCNRAVILPHSFRSALLPALAGIPVRRGTVSQPGRGLLITDPVSLSEMENLHQQWEIARLLLPGTLPDALPAPVIHPSPEASSKASDILHAFPRPVLGCIPGAARGPSKQWPGERFQAVGEAWIEQTNGSVCWLGTPADRDLCAQLNAPLGERGLNIAGQTDLKTFTAVVARLDKALVNDSGGMHLAAATGTPLVAVFGETDPAKTGPLSQKAVVIQHSDQRHRSIHRNSASAREALEKVSVHEVLEPLLANSTSSA